VFTARTPPCNGRVGGPYTAVSTALYGPCTCVDHRVRGPCTYATVYRAMYTRVHARTWSCKWAGHTWPCDGRVHGPCTGVTSNMALCFVCGCDHNSFRESCKYYMFRIGAVYTAITPPCTKSWTRPIYTAVYWAVCKRPYTDGRVPRVHVYYTRPVYLIIIVYLQVCHKLLRLHP